MRAAEEPQWTCPRCSQVIAPGDTVGFSDGEVSHLDCRRRRMLSNEERTLLYRYCFAHPMAECPTCQRSLRQTELATDLFLGYTYLCSTCRQDVTESIRAHLYACAMVPSEVRRRAKTARETAQALIKQSQQLIDEADVLAREAEAALALLRETMRQSLKLGDAPSP